VTELSEAFALSEDEATAVSEAASAFAAALPPGREGPFVALADAAGAGAGALSAGHVATLERVCVLTLETGKARQIGSAETERLLTAVYRRTPGGKALSGETADVNRMLTQFAGRTLQAVRVSCRTPGRYQLNLTVDGISTTIAIEPEGLEVRSLETG
jgi:hypothetical protein